MSIEGRHLEDKGTQNDFHARMEDCDFFASQRDDNSLCLIPSWADIF